VVFVGFQAEGTPGRRLVEGAKTIRLLGDELAVKARIFTINGFSAPAGQSQILDWLGHFQNRQMQVLLIHGEFPAQKILEELIRKRFGLEVCIPEHLEETVLKPGRALGRKAFPEKAPPNRLGVDPRRNGIPDGAAPGTEEEDRSKRVGGADRSQRAVPGVEPEPGGNSDGNLMGS
jgi:hypothetical protein